MKGFKVLEYNQISMRWAGIHSKDLHKPTNEFFKSFATYYILFSVISFTIGSSAVYIYKNSTHFEMVSEPILIVIAGLQAGGMFLSVGLNMKKIKILHIKLQEIVDESMSNWAFVIWKENNNTNNHICSL